MRLCLVGKFPPIQGGVSARTYRLAHALARRGHAVHVVTNAMEVEDAFRVRLEPGDEARLGGRYGEGYVRVHQTVSDPVGQAHVPAHNPFATKLAGLAIEVIRDHRLECVFSWYLEPYGVAGHLAASFTGTPHVMRTAGSDAGRLWHQPGMRTLYDHVFLAADVVMAGGGLRRSLAELGVRPERIAPCDGAFVPLDEFAPEGDRLDLAAFGGRNAATVGLFGKLGRFKGMHALVRAVRSCLDRGLDVQLAAMTQGRAEEEQGFAELLDRLGLADRVVRVPFLPHWRVPGFLRACDVVCCLEQGFPIKAHAPVVAQEVLATGRPLVVSQEIAAKQPDAHRLAHGYNCWVVRDGNDAQAIARCLLDILSEPRSAALVGARGREVAEHVQALGAFPAAHESALRLAVEGTRPRTDRRARGGDPGTHGLADLLGLVRREVEHEAERRGVTLPSPEAGEVEWFRDAQDAFDAAGPSSANDASAAALGLELALQLFAARHEGTGPSGEGLFRLKGETPRWDLGSLARHRPSLAPGVVARRYPSNPLELLTGGGAGRAAVVVVLPFAPAQAVRLFALSGPAAELVAASDGAASLEELAPHLGTDGDALAGAVRLAEELFALGLLSLSAPAEAAPVAAAAAR